MSIIQGNSKSSAAGYNIDQSIRFNDDDDAHLYSTSFSASPTSSTDCTFSTWVKRGNFGSYQVLVYGGNPAGSTAESIRFDNDDVMRINQASSAYNLETNQVFRDVAGWYHIVVAFDTDNATASERIKLYVNGERVTSFSTETYPSSGYSTNFTSGAASVAHVLGANAYEGSGPDSQHLDGYQAEINFIDGQALGPENFGEVNSDTGQWVPIKYTGSYGTNGFYITGATATDLGEDFSGNNNDFTSSSGGFTAADQVTDSPTDNTATLNPLNRVSSGTFSDGNLQFAETSGSSSRHAKSTIGFTSGEKKVAEMEIVSGSTITFGICDEDFDANSNSYTGDSRGYVSNGKKTDGSGTQTTYGATYTTGDVIRIEVDLSSNPGSIEFFKNGTSQGTAWSDITSTKTWFFWCRCKSDTIKANFGQLGFAGTPTAGFTAPTVANLDDPTIDLPEKYFNTVLYEGNGGGQRVGQFQPITETYTVPNSVIFNDDDSAYLEKTFASDGDRRTWTFSTWVKFANLDLSNNILFASWISSGASAYQSIYIDGTNNLRLEDQSNNRLIANRVFKDASAWYHIVARVDTTDATSADRFQLYVNGVRVTSFSTETQPPLNFEGNINKGSQPHYLGRNGYSLNMIYSDLYQAETHFIDGTALDASSFGQLDASTNKWIPKAYSGSYGTNGFYLDMETAPGTGSGAGTDSSGNGNNFTESGFAASDQVTDSPTESFATLNPLRKGSNVTLSDGNLVADCGSSSSSTRAFSTVGMPNSGKWTFQIEAVSSTFAGTDSLSSIGIISDPYTNNTDVTSSSKIGISTNQENAGLDFYNGFTKKDNASQITAAQLRNAGDKGIVAYDAGTKELWLGYAQSTDSSWTWVGGGDPEAGTSPTYTMSEDNQYFAISTDRSKTIVRFGSNGDGITPPTGFDYLNNDNLPLSNGDLSAFVWIKNRDATDNHMLFDAVRGVTKDMHSNTSDVEVTNANTLTRFLKNGFEVSNDVQVNTSAESYVAWQWLNDSLTTSSNADGSITSTVLANTTSGVSIATYTGNATVGATVGHGLGVAPKVVIVKSRSNGESWVFGHDSMGWTKAMYLQSNGAPFTLDIYWNNTAPTSSVVELHDHPVTNGSGYTYVMYSFAEVEGFSKFGMYTGNGSTDGTFVYTGFKPAFVLWKQFTNLGTNNFIIRDSAREPYNVVDTVLFPNTTAADTTGLNGYGADLLSNGFKLRGNDGAVNKASSDYLYMAFSESPFKTATAR